jgi:hypothetical protein
MSIHYQAGGRYIDVNTPFIKLAANQWTIGQQVNVKTGQNTWSEVWPMTRTYIHVGTGYNMNIAACFGYPTQPGKFIFINNGNIYGVVGGSSLTTGGLPAGSTLTIINNGWIVGAGGVGGEYSAAYVPLIYPTNGGDALTLQYPADLQNNGYIWGGGGGGSGGSGGQKRDCFAVGGPGAGAPTSPPNKSGWHPALYWSSPAATIDTGAIAAGGNGGNPGQPGTTCQLRFDRKGSGFTQTLPVGQGGRSIVNSGYLTSFTGNNANQIKGAIV